MGIRMKPEDENNIRVICDEYLSKSQLLYVVFYSTLALCTLLSGVAQLLVYEETNNPDDARGLDLAAMIMTTVSTLALQILAISGMNSVAAAMNRVGRLLNVYLSPFANEKEKKEIVAKVLELTSEIEPFWVSLPRFKDGRHLPDILRTEEHTRVEMMLAKRPTSSRL